MIRRPRFPDLAVGIEGFRIVTCDVFDTAVLRRLARPEDLHLATGARLAASRLTTAAPDAFREWRIAAEQAARREAAGQGRDEPRLAAIYAHLAACGIIANPEAAAEAEIAAELAACVPNQPVLAALAARAEAQRLVFVSDTVLPGAAVARLLDACRYGAGCTVFTSADAGRSKHAGGLFAHVIAALGCAPREIVHIGDNPHSDGRMARAAGLATIALPPPARPPEREEIAGRAPVLRLLHSHRRAATAPAAGETPSGRFAGLHRYATLLAIGFTLFILAEARRRGVRRIHFLARDGWLPLQIARRLVARSGEDFELCYLEASRQSIVVPTMRDELPALADFAAHGVRNRPIGGVLGFLGVAEAETSSRLRALGIDPARPVTGPAEVARLFEAAADLIRARLEARADDARAYLAQSGFLEPGPKLIVDVGWRGTTQQALARLTGIDPEAIGGCYLGLLPHALRPGITPQTTACYLFSFGHPAPAMARVMDGYALLEMFFSAPHGPVLHYAREEARIVPLHAEEAGRAGAIRRDAFAAIGSGCLAEFDALDALLGGAWPEAIDPGSALHDLDPLLTTPSTAEIAAINAIPFINGADGTHNQVPINRMKARGFLRDPEGALRRAADCPWRAGWVRAHLPWPFPPMTYATFRDRAGRWLPRRR